MRPFRMGDVVEHERWGRHVVIADQREGAFVRVACEDCGSSDVGASELSLVAPAD